jgi:hypothetical protein
MALAETAASTGIAPAIPTGMKSRHSALKQKSSRAFTMIRWEFMRGRDRLTCQVDREPGTGQFAVAIVPHRCLQWASIETFKAVAAALRRHASVASQLRASGWKLVAYTA